MEYAFIYKISWYESKKHRVSGTDMYYLNSEDTTWIYERCWNDEVVKVEYIRVLKNSVYYSTAYESSVIVPLRRKVKQYYSDLTYVEINAKNEDELKQMINDYEKNMYIKTRTIDHLTEKIDELKSRLNPNVMEMEILHVN